MFLIYGEPDDERLVNIINLMHRRKKEYEIRPVGDNENLMFLYDRGHTSVPQVFKLEENTDELLHIGGYSDLVSYIEMVTEIER